MRGPLPRIVVCPAIGDAMETSKPDLTLVWTHPGDPALNDQLAIPGIPADAPPPAISVTAARPFRSATPIIVILIACTLLYLAVRMLGLPS